MRLRDVTFQGVFAHVFVYNILFEDSEVDERYLGVGADSSVLAISGAGCRVAGHLSAHPRRVDAVDINKQHLALTALKVAAARKLRSYDTFHQMFAAGRVHAPERLLRGLVSDLPDWVQKHWRSRHAVFDESLHNEGAAATMFGALRKLAQVDGRWLESLARVPSSEDRMRAVERAFGPILRSPAVKAALESPVTLVALGINYEQCERMLRAESTEIGEFLLRRMMRFAGTDLWSNWFAWHAVAGHFNPDAPEGVPPYLRRDRHERSLSAPTLVRFHNRDIFRVLGDAAPRTWTHYTLCDAVDWMPPATQRRLFEEILRTSKDGGAMVYRSVEPGSIAARLGLERHFHLDVGASQKARVEERTQIFHAVNYYRIVH